jgi:hypothetical protein
MYSSQLWTHTATFTWVPQSESRSRAAVIDFGAIYHTLRASVNGQTLPPLDPTWAPADISKYLRPGENTMVSTPLLNTLRPLWSSLMSGANGTSTHISVQPPLDYGLQSAVKIFSY